MLKKKKRAHNSAARSITQSNPSIPFKAENRNNEENMNPSVLKSRERISTRIAERAEEVGSEWSEAEFEVI
jgi:hypothetical protein